MRTAFIIALVWALVFMLAVMGVASWLGDSMADDGLHPMAGHRQHRAVLEGAVYR